MQQETNSSDFAGCENPPVTVTREGGVSLPRLAERGCGVPEGGGAQEGRAVCEKETESERVCGSDAESEWKNDRSCEDVSCRCPWAERVRVCRGEHVSA